MPRQPRRCRHAHRSRGPDRIQPVATCKRETLQGRGAWADEREARLDLFHWLHRYNTRRRHSSLGQRSPIAYETALDTTSTTLGPSRSPYPRFRVRPRLRSARRRSPP
ncbi:integrase core domain-containing protein [Streptomyces sp. T028]|uniref:integrase core domain-containing protein n=1 Tax=Streptomyces sp. T028 TaxID=3394379 RepID=UPI003A87880F